jgi:hypothetical protein
VTLAEAPPRQARQILPALERRRSQRVMIRVPVTLQVTIVKQVVAIRAARPTHPWAETKLEIQNHRTRQKLPCRVAGTARDSPEGYLIPVESEVASPGFWHTSFLPTDWSRPRLVPFQLGAPMGRAGKATTLELKSSGVRIFLENHPAPVYSLPAWGVRKLSVRAENLAFGSRVQAKGNSGGGSACWTDPWVPFADGRR